MSKRTDTNEATQFQGTVTVTTSSNPVDYGGGNIELEGALFTDTIMENTDAVGVNLEGTNFSDNYFTMTAIASPSNPPSGQQRIFVDIFDNLLKTKNDNGIVTVYQPLTTKGDLLTHNGTNQVRLTVGDNGKSLISDSTMSEGIKWDYVLHSTLTGLLNDDHTQYTLLAGRTGGQILTGGTAPGNNLTIRSTSSVTKGSILIDETTASTSVNTGALIVSGGIGISNTTDAVSATNGGTITTAGGIAIAKKAFIGTDLSVGETTLFNNYFQTVNITAPSVPPASNIRFYTDSTDSLLKSKNSSGTVTTYQPTTTKGDLQSHNGTTQVRVPIGLNNAYLIADSSQSTGLRWGNIGNSMSDIYTISNKKSIETTYNVITSFLYKGSSNVGLWTTIHFSSYKNSTESFSYSIRVWDVDNKNVIAEITNLTNTVPTTYSTSSISNIPSSPALIEIQSKLTIRNNYGVIHNSFKFDYT